MSVSGRSDGSAKGCAGEEMTGTGRRKEEEVLGASKIRGYTMEVRGGASTLVEPASEGCLGCWRAAVVPLVTEALGVGVMHRGWCRHG
ncbi:hypothetical protein U1Q18_037989 [Sarracenia purpurea var. burkii]